MASCIETLIDFSRNITTIPILPTISPKRSLGQRTTHQSSTGWAIDRSPKSRLSICRRWLTLAHANQTNSARDHSVIMQPRAMMRPGSDRDRPKMIDIWNLNFEHAQPQGQASRQLSSRADANAIGYRCTLLLLCL